MRIGLLGDIHGNHLALQAVLDSARQARVEALLVTGDLVGYYFAPRRALELLERWRTWIVRGNHEDMLALVRADGAALEAIEHKYGIGLRIALRELSPQQLDRLCQLPHPLDVQLDSRRILLCHGAPWDNDCYVYPDACREVLERCALQGHDLVVLGHTHYAMVHQLGATTVVNPGSVGQPRDRHPGAAWALYDTTSGEVELRRETYAVERMVAEARRLDPAHPYLANVLQRK